MRCELLRCGSHVRGVLGKLRSADILHGLGKDSLAECTWFVRYYDQDQFEDCGVQALDEIDQFKL
jgi:hypothetical protein